MAANDRLSIPPYPFIPSHLWYSVFACFDAFLTHTLPFSLFGGLKRIKYRGMIGDRQRRFLVKLMATITPLVLASELPWGDNGSRSDGEFREPYHSLSPATKSPVSRMSEEEQQVMFLMATFCLHII